MRSDLQTLLRLSGYDDVGLLAGVSPRTPNQHTSLGYFAWAGVLIWSSGGAQTVRPTERIGGSL